MRLRCRFPCRSGSVPGGGNGEEYGDSYDAVHDARYSVDSDAVSERGVRSSELASGGVIEMPIAFQPWGDYWGSFKDKYSVLWMVGYTPPKK